MKTKLFGLLVTLFAVFTTGAAAAANLAGTGCCPLCK